MFAYCLNNPAKHKDSQGFFTESFYDEILDLDDPDNFCGGVFACAPNPIDTGYQYRADLSIAANSSFVSGGLYGNGYGSYSTHSLNGGNTSPNPQSVNSGSTQPKENSKGFDPNQQALVAILKPYTKSGISMSEAYIAVEWGIEYGFQNCRIDPGHERGNNDDTRNAHLHIGPFNHIRIY
jgi:hypothetical protein